MRDPIIRELGDGLILRRASADDAAALATFNAQIHRQPRSPEPDQTIATWTRDLMTRPHPTLNAGDFTIVEDTRTGAIVSSANLISQTWSYAGVDFGVGRPELVGTDPTYRQRGLVRAQFEVLHEWSTGRGELLQAITGIPYFYRQFGYEMTVDLGGSRTLYRTDLPVLPSGISEPYRVRPAADSDVAFLIETYQTGSKRSLLTCVRDEAIWRYELTGRSPASMVNRSIGVIESIAGNPVGLVVHAAQLAGSDLVLHAYELTAGASWLAVTPSVARYLRDTGDLLAAGTTGAACQRVVLELGASHPAYPSLGRALSRAQSPYAWYLRVPNLAEFLNAIRPVLDRRLAESAAAGHTGELKLSFFRHGLRLAFERGRLTATEAWRPTSEDRGDASFPDHTFLHVLFGYRTTEEISYILPDCRVLSLDAGILLDALFPKQSSFVWPVE